MTDATIASALTNLPYVVTLAQHVRNDLVHVGGDHVVVRSVRTGKQRTIPYTDIRNARNVTRNGCVVRALASYLGLPH